jgi:hypothetical protein
MFINTNLRKKYSVSSYGEKKKGSSNGKTCKVSLYLSLWDCGIHLI